MSRAQRKKPALRAFIGLAGSSLAVVKPEAPAQRRAEPILAKLRPALVTVEPPVAKFVGAQRPIEQRPVQGPSFVSGPLRCPKCARKKPVCYRTTFANGTVKEECVCRYLAMWKPGTYVPVAPEPTRAKTAAERKARSRVVKNEIQPLEKEQNTDAATGGVYGPGLYFATDALTGVGPPPGGRMTTGGYGGDHLVSVMTARARKEENETIFGGRKIEPCGHSGAEESNDFNEKDWTFQRRHPIARSWTYDRREKQEIARRAAPNFIVELNPQTTLKWDTECFVPWDGVVYVCKVCHRVFAFPRHAEEHIIEIIDDVLIKKPEFHAEVKHNLDITRHRRAVLKGITECQPQRTHRKRA